MSGNPSALAAPLAAESEPEEVPDIIDRAEARRIQAAIDEAALNFAVLERSQRGLRR